MSFRFRGVNKAASLGAFVIRFATSISMLGILSGCGGEEAGSLSDQSMLGSQSMQSSAASNSGTNAIPVISDVVLHPGQPTSGRQVKASARVTDPDGDRTTVTYRWQTVQGRVLGEGPIFETTGLRPGSRLKVIATASDGRAESDPVAHSFRLSEPSLEIGFVAIEASDGTQPGVVLRAVVELLNDESARSAADLEWQVNGQLAGTEDRLETSKLEPGDRVVLRARIAGADSRSRFVSSESVVLTRGGAPNISSKPLSGVEGGLFRYQIRAHSDEPEAELTYALLSGPDGMKVDSQSGMVQWRPTSAQRGRFEIEVSATDQWGTGTAQSFTIVADAALPASPR